MTNFNISIDESKIREELQKLAMENARKTSRWQVEKLFQEKTTYPHVDGDGTKIIKGMIDDLILNDEENLRKIREHITHHYDRLLEEATIRAMTHRANKLAFAEVNEQAPRLKKEPS